MPNSEVTAAREANINAWADAIGAGDADTWRTCFAPSATIREEALSDDTVEPGELRDYAARVFDCIRIERPTIVTVVHDDEYAMVHWRMTGEAVAPWPGLFDPITPGARFSFDGVSKFTFDQNFKYASQHVFWDRRTLAQQIMPETDVVELLLELRHLHLKHLDTSGRFVANAQHSFAKIDELHGKLLAPVPAG